MSEEECKLPWQRAIERQLSDENAEPEMGPLSSKDWVFKLVFLAALLVVGATLGYIFYSLWQLYVVVR